MRADLFHRLIKQVPAVYWSEKPLFLLGEGHHVFDQGRFAGPDGPPLVFAAAREDYAITGGPAWPETVRLIAVPEHPELSIFQQSDAGAIAYYGALRPTAERGFELFSPEAVAEAALGAAIGNNATPSGRGYRFTSQAQLFAALVPVALEAPATAWNRYRRI